MGRLASRFTCLEGGCAALRIHRTGLVAMPVAEVDAGSDLGWEQHPVHDLAELATQMGQVRSVGIGARHVRPAAIDGGSRWPGNLPTTAPAGTVRWPNAGVRRSRRGRWLSRR